MAGFLSPGLAAATTVGAFVQGAAKQMDQNMVQANLLDQAHQQQWALKVDKAVQDYNKQHTADDDLADKYNYFRDALGDEYLADQATSSYKADPKQKPQDIVASIRPAPGSNYTAPSGYKSNILSNLSNTQQTREQALQSQMGQLGGSSKYITSPMPATDYAQRNQGPAPPQGYQPTGTVLNKPIEGVKPSGLDEFDTAQHYQNHLTSVKNNPNDPSKWDYTGAIAGPRTKENADKDTLHNLTPDEADYVKNPKYGVNFQTSQIGQLLSNRQNLDSIADLLDRGFSSGKTQDWKDAANGWANALGFDLKKDLGIDANSYQDSSQLKKDTAQAVIAKLQTLHFGRITNAEMKVVTDGLASPTNNPSTNMKIILALSAPIKREIDGANAIDNALHPGGQAASHDSVRDARLLEQHLRNSQIEQKAPWIQIDESKPDSIKELANLQPDQWFENKTNGTMYKMIGKQGNNYILKSWDSKGVPIQVTVPVQ